MRRGFIRKVYGILSVQLLISIVFIALCVFDQNVKSFVYANPLLLWVSMIMSLVLVCAVSCVDSLRHSYPTNLIFLFLLTSFFSYMLGFISSTYATDAVLQALLITATVTLTLTLFTFQSKMDFSNMGGCLLLSLICFILVGFLRLIFPFSPVMHTIYAGIGALLFSL